MFTTVQSITTTYVTTIFPAVSAIHNALRRQAAHLSTHREELAEETVKDARMHEDGGARTLQVLTLNHGWISVLPGDKVVQYKTVTEELNEQEFFYNEVFADQEEPELMPNVVVYQLAQGYKIDHYKLHQVLVRLNARIVMDDEGWFTLAPVEYVRVALEALREVREA